MATNRIELSGRLVRTPELRTTPGGTPVLRFVVECCDPPERMRLTVTVTGEEGRRISSLLKASDEVMVEGRLRESATRAAGVLPGVEVLASRVTRKQSATIGGK